VDVTEFGLRLILLFLPGIICASLVDALTTHPQRTQFQFTLRALILGVASYGVLALFRPSISFFAALSDLEVVPSLVEAGCASAIALGMAVVLTYIANYKIHFRVAHLVRLTRRFGDQDVWSYLFNSLDVEWVTIRDHKRNLVYDGRVRFFSEADKPAELYLQDVKVYDNATGEYLYDVAGMYVSLERTDLTIEFHDATLKPKTKEERRRWPAKRSAKVR
jgi:putative flippase GtrA